MEAPREPRGRRAGRPGTRPPRAAATSGPRLRLRHGGAPAPRTHTRAAGVRAPRHPHTPSRGRAEAARPAQPITRRRRADPSAPGRAAARGPSERVQRRPPSRDAPLLTSAAPLALLSRSLPGGPTPRACGGGGGGARARPRREGLRRGGSVPQGGRRSITARGPRSAEAGGPHSGRLRCCGGARRPRPGGASTDSR